MKESSSFFNMTATATLVNPEAITFTNKLKYLGMAGHPPYYRHNHKHRETLNAKFYTLKSK